MPSSTLTLHRFIISLMLPGTLLLGCDPSSAEVDHADDAIAQTQQALTSCAGSVQKTGTISDQYGYPLGTIQLYYSTSTHAICGLASFSAAHGSFQICATDNTDVSQPPQCLSYSAATNSGATPSQLLRVGDTGSTTVFVSSPTLGSGLAGYFTRTF